MTFTVDEYSDRPQEAPWKTVEVVRVECGNRLNVTSQGVVCLGEVFEKKSAFDLI